MLAILESSSQIFQSGSQLYLFDVTFFLTQAVRHLGFTLRTVCGRFEMAVSTLFATLFAGDFF